LLRKRFFEKQRCRKFPSTSHERVALGAPSKKSQGMSCSICVLGIDCEGGVELRRGCDSSTARLCIAVLEEEEGQSSKIFLFWLIQIPHITEKGSALNFLGDAHLAIF
jgi:hypothetical protein